MVLCQMTLYGNGALALVSSVLCFVFAGLLFQQWRHRRRPYQLVWTFGMLCYAVAAGADAAGQLAGWNDATYRIWYLFGAVAAAAWLGLGEVYLMRAPGFGELVGLGIFLGAIPAMITGGKLLGTHQDAAAQGAIALGLAGIAGAGIIALISWERPSLVGHATLVLLVTGTLLAAYRILGAPVDTALMVDPATHVPQGAAFPQNVRLMTPMFNIGGALALLLGAIYSAWSFWRRGESGERLASNGLIALGAFAPSLTSSLNRFGITGFFYWGELLGVLLIFAGFLASSEIFSRRLLGRRAGAAPPKAARVAT
jgi:hypothetical protein